MNKKSSPKTQPSNRKLIDFLEDPDFRNWVFCPEKGLVERNGFWENEVRHNVQANKAKYILRALKLHFEKNNMSHEDIEDRLEQEIDKYRLSGQYAKRKYFQMTGLLRTAAAVILLVGLFFLIQWMNRPFDEYTTGFGEQLTIELSDESVIRLNSNSRLTWDRNWEKAGVRMVQLDGEAFFDVEHREGIPFQVQTDDITVHVTGTQFNVNSRRQKTMVFLDKGKVNVSVRERPDQKYEMEPGDELIYQAVLDQVEQRRVDAPEEISAWKEGMLVFREESLLDVLKSVSDIYGKEFIVKDTALIDRNITTTIPLTNWDVSLTAIQLAMQLQVEVDRDTVWIRERK